jgi:hypothetical protein
VAAAEVYAGQIDSSRPNTARVYDYLLGGRENFAADRALGDRIISVLPEAQTGVRAQRAVLARAVRYLVTGAGVRQLLDIGSGLPTADNVHEVARRCDAATRVVYVDNDAVVLCHARALLADNHMSFAESGDLLRPESIIGSPAVRGHLDWDQPIGLLLCGILHFVQDEQDPAGLVAAIADALPPGSHVFIHHLLDTGDDTAAELQAQMMRGLGKARFRTLEEVRTLFGGLELVPPGVVPVPRWRPDTDAQDREEHANVLRMACAGLARKP